jgi:thiamine pyrophosphokinase
MGNINVLYRFSNIKIILLSDDCSIFLLPKTHSHEIHIEKSVEGPHCGLIPMSGPSNITTTTGLRWNLGKSITPYKSPFLYSCIWQCLTSLYCTSSSDNTSMRYGGLISTSNIVDDDKVTVTSDSDLIWTISLRN